MKSGLMLHLACHRIMQGAKDLWTSKQLEEKNYEVTQENVDMILGEIKKCLLSYLSEPSSTSQTG